MGLVQSILTIKLYFNHLPGDYFAFLVVLFSFQIIFSFLDFGLSNAIVNRGVAYLVKKKYQSLSMLFGGALVFLGCWLIVLNGLVFLAFEFTPLKYYIFPGLTDVGFVVQTFLICSVFSTIRCCFAIVNNFRFVYNQAYFNGIFDSAALALSILLQVIGVYLQVSFQTHVMIIFGVPVLGHVCNLLLLYRQNSYLLDGFVKNVVLFFRFEVKKILKEGVKFFFLQLASTVAYNSVPIVLSLYSRTSEIAIYGVLARLFNPVSSLITVFLQPQWAYMAQCFLKREFSKIRKSYEFSLLFVIVICLGYVLALYLAKGLVTTYVIKSDDVRFSVLIIILFVCWIIFSNLAGVYSTVLNSLNAITYQVRYSFLVMILFAIQVLLFVPQYGLASILLFASINVAVTGILPAFLKINKVLHE